MSNVTFFRIPKTFQFSFMSFLLTVLLAFCEAQYLNEEEILSNLRPLKYSSESCAEFCGKITCEPIKECKDGVILKNESYCNCCEACVKILDIGDSCRPPIKGSLALGSQSRCRIGTSCNKHGKCELDEKENSCLRHRDNRNQTIQTGKYSKEIWLPQCDKEGNYVAKQKKVSKSICIEKSGNKIFGSAQDSLENACACSRYMQEKEEKDPISLHVKPHEHCSSTGSFDTLQCIGNLCYCADANTGQVKSELVRLEFLDKLPCYDKKSHSKNYLKDCEIQLQRSKKLAHDFSKKGVRIIGIDDVDCDPDGTFSPTQCLPERCVCTSKTGRGIRQYQKETFRNNMTCNCARDEAFSCKTDGSYKPFSCVESICVCVDEDGERISQELQVSETKSCEKMVQDLLYPVKNIVEISSTDSDYASSYDYDYTDDFE